MDKTINIHAVIASSVVNGPGRRAVVFFQGCERGCPGCFNQATHPFTPANVLTAEEVLARISPGIEGITVSGGEPFMQSAGLLSLLRAARARGLTTVVYTGFRLHELTSPEARECLEHTDVLIDGPFEMDLAEPTMLARGSSNQRLHFLTRRYGPGDFVMPGKVELTIGADGTVTETGFSRIPIGVA